MSVVWNVLAAPSICGRTGSTGDGRKVSSAAAGGGKVGLAAATVGDSVSRGCVVTGRAVGSVGVRPRLGRAGSAVGRTGSG